MPLCNHVSKCVSKRRLARARWAVENDKPVLLKLIMNGLLQRLKRPAPNWEECNTG